MCRHSDYTGVRIPPRVKNKLKISTKPFHSTKKSFIKKPFWFLPLYTISWKVPFNRFIWQFRRPTALTRVDIDNTKIPLWITGYFLGNNKLLGLFFLSFLFYRHPLLHTYFIILWEIIKNSPLRFSLTSRKFSKKVQKCIISKLRICFF